MYLLFPPYTLRCLLLAFHSALRYGASTPQLGKSTIGGLSTDHLYKPKNQSI
jgi:hypothetical protein